MVAMQEFEEFIDKHGGASRGDSEVQYLERREWEEEGVERGGYFKI